MKYTEGKWKALMIRDKPWLSIEAKGEEIAIIFDDSLEARANAQLIASAPRMHKLLTRLMGIDFDTDDENYEELRPILDDVYELLAEGR